MLKLFASDEVDVPQMAGLLRSDPALSAQLLAVANSAFYGSKHHIDNMARAILVLGFERAKALTMTVAMGSFLKHCAKSKAMENCWRHGLAAALVAEELAPLFEFPKDQAYIAALTHDIGRLGLLMAYDDLYSPLLETPHETHADCLESERTLFEMDHCQAGLWLTERWGFPPPYSRAVGCHHDDLPGRRQDLASLTHASCLLADALGFPAVVINQAPSTAEIVEQLPSDPWHRYIFDTETLQNRITEHLSTVTLQ